MNTVAKPSDNADTRAIALLRHLLGASTAIRARVGEEVASRGHQLTGATAQVMVSLPIEGLGMSDLAARLRLTLQRTGQLVSQLEELGYVERTADENDGRAKRVAYTARGRHLLEDIDATDMALTQEIAELLGKQRFARLCRDLEALDVALNGPDHVLRL